MIYFQISLHSEILGFRTLTYTILVRDTIQLITGSKDNYWFITTAQPLFPKHSEVQRSFQSLATNPQVLLLSPNFPLKICSQVGPMVTFLSTGHLSTLRENFNLIFQRERIMVFFPSFQRAPGFLFHIAPLLNIQKTKERGTEKGQHKPIKYPSSLTAAICSLVGK